MAYVTDKIDSLFGLFKNAKLIAQDIDITPLSQELIQEDGSTRYAVPSLQWPHREGVQVPLRIALKKHGNMPFSGNILKSIESPIYKEFPKIKAWVTCFEVTQKGKAGRVFTATLPPHKQVYRHADRGMYFSVYDRYHLVIRSDGTHMRIGDQNVNMHQGELWWINNKIGHESFNTSNQPRTHLVIDLLPHSILRRIRNVLFWLYFGLRPRRLTNYYINWPRRFQATS